MKKSMTRKLIAAGLTVLMASIGAAMVFGEVALPAEYKAVTEAKKIEQADFRGQTIAVNVNDTTGKSFRKVQSAIDAIKVAPTKEEERITISIAPGVYVEKVVVDKPFLSFVNADPKKGEVVITFNAGSGQKVQPGYEDRCNALTAWGTETTGTVAIGKSKYWQTAQADNFIAKNITFKNHYNTFQDLVKAKVGDPDQTQACAIVTFADRIIFDNCKFIGRQDTVYFKGGPGRIYVKDSYVEGTVDYIFGDATVVFDNCQINSVARSDGQAIYTAANTMLNDLGYVFIDCKLTADSYYKANSSQVKLGRPWQGDASELSRGSHTAYINTTVTDQLFEEGWQAWGPETITSKIRYMEYNTKLADGTKANISKRLSWTQQLTAEQANAYTAFNVLRSRRDIVDNWNPSGAKVDVNAPVKVAGIIITDASTPKNLYTVTVPATTSKNDAGKPAQLKALVLPMSATNKAYTWKSADEKIAKISADGLVTGVAEGKTQVFAVSADGGFTVPVDVIVAGAPTAPPVLKGKAAFASSGKISTIYPKDKITLQYGYALDKDNKNDCSVIKWYRVKKDKTEEFIKQGVATSASSKEYVVAYKDVDCVIKAVLAPETSTTYGAVGATSEIKTKTVKAPVGGIPQVFVDDSFANFDAWNLAIDGKANADAFTVIADPANAENKVFTSRAPVRSVVSMQPKKTFAAKDAMFEFQFRIRAGSGGVTVNDKVEFMLNYTENPDGTVKDGYSVIFERVSNGMSLAVSLGKYENGKYTFQNGVGAVANQALGIPAASEHTRMQLDRTENTMYKGVFTVSGGKVTLVLTELVSGKSVGNKTGVPVGNYYFFDRSNQLGPGGFIFKETVCKPDCLQFDNFYIEEVKAAKK